MTAIQSLVQGRLQVPAEHGRNRTRLLENGRPLGQLPRAIPSSQQSGVSRKRARFKQAAEETKGIQLKISQFSELKKKTKKTTTNTVAWSVMLTVSTFFAPAMAMTRTDQKTSHSGIQMEGLMYRSWIICVGTVPMR